MSCMSSKYNTCMVIEVGIISQQAKEMHKRLTHLCINCMACLFSVLKEVSVHSSRMYSEKNILEDKGE